MPKRYPNTIVIAGSIALVFTFATIVSAAPLTGSGPNLPIPVPNPGEPPRVGAALSGITGSGFNGSWSAPALAPWVGSFSATGPVPSGLPNPVGSTRYNFTTLPTNVLPTGTYFTFGDVDGGSVTNETFVLHAYDSGGGLITSPWLNEILALTGTGTGSGGTILPGNLPGWEWDPGLSQYTIDGSTVTGGNPTLTVWFESNTPMSLLNVQRTSAFANFGLSAPVPEPAAIVFLLSGSAIATIYQRRRRRKLMYNGRGKATE